MSKTVMLLKLVGELGTQLEMLLDEKYNSCGEVTKQAFYNIIMNAIEDAIEYPKAPVSIEEISLEELIKDVEKSIYFYQRN